MKIHKSQGTFLQSCNAREITLVKCFTLCIFVILNLNLSVYVYIYHQITKQQNILKTASFLSLLIKFSEARLILLLPSSWLKSKKAYFGRFFSQTWANYNYYSSMHNGFHFFVSFHLYCIFVNVHM